MPPRHRVTLGPIKNHYEAMLDNLSGLCWEEKMCDITFICTGDGINIHAHTSLLKNVSKLVKDTQVYLLTQPKLVITLEGVFSNTVHILLQFLYIGKIQLKETDADNLHSLCQMLKIDFGEEMVSVLNKDNMEIYPQPKTGTTKPKQPPPKVKSPTPISPTPDINITARQPVHPHSPQNSLKMTIKSGTVSSNVSKSPHAPKSQIVPQKYVMPPKRKADTLTSTISPHYPANPKPYDILSSKLERRASSSSISSTNSVVRDTNLYCYCRKPTSKDLIGCDFCPEWYHQACLGISDETVKAILELPVWKCPECEKKSSVVKKAKLVKQGPMYLPIPNGAKFCEVKATRMDTWGTKDYEAKGFIPLDNKLTWVSIIKTSEIQSSMEIPPLPDDLLDDEMKTNNNPENEVEGPRSQIVQISQSTPDKSDRIKPSEVLHKKGVQAPSKTSVEQPSDTIQALLADDDDDKVAAEDYQVNTLTKQRTTGLTQIHQSPPRPIEIAHTSPESGDLTPGPPQVVMNPAPPSTIPPRPVGRPRIKKETGVAEPPIAVVEPTLVSKEPQADASPTDGKLPVAVKSRPRPVQRKEEDKVPRLSTSEAAIERMKNEMRVAQELKLIEEAERIREEAEKRTKFVKAVPNGSKDTVPASRRGRRPKYRPIIPGKLEPNKNEAEVTPQTEVDQIETASEPDQIPTLPQPELVQQLKVKTPKGRRSSPQVSAQNPATPAVSQPVIRNIKKEKFDDPIVKNIKQEKVTDHSMEEIQANEPTRTKSKRNLKGLSNQSQCDNESSFEGNDNNTSLDTDDKGEDESADSSKNESYDELFFCYVCKSIYVSKKALAAHQKSAHSK